MVECLECKSTAVVEPMCPTERSEEYRKTVVRYYECQKCGCEWSESFETTRTVAIEKHGIKYYEGKVDERRKNLEASKKIERQ
jgi:transposase-like protein